MAKIESCRQRGGAYQYMIVFQGDAPGKKNTTIYFSEDELKELKRHVDYLLSHV